MAAYSLAVYREFEDRIGGPSGFVQTGYVVIVGTEFRDHLERNVAALQATGIEVRLFGPGAFADVLPYADMSDVAGVSFSGTRAMPTAG